jgi:hypothetical protein
VGPAMFAGMQGAFPGGDPTGADALAAMSGGMILLQLLNFLVALVLNAVLMGAIYRAILEPENKGFFYLRVGAQEMWLLLLTIVLFFLVLAAVIVCAIPLGLLGAGVFMAMRNNIESLWPLIVLLALAFYVGVIWVSCRLGLAGPMTFAERRLVIFESWTLTAGNGWKLVGMMICIILAMIAAIIVFYILIALLFVVVGAAAFGGQIFSGNAGLENMNWAVAIPLFLILGLALIPLFSFLLAGIMAVVTAPFANVYKQLRPSEAQVF